MLPRIINSYDCENFRLVNAGTWHRAFCSWEKKAAQLVSLGGFESIDMRPGYAPNRYIQQQGLFPVADQSAPWPVRRQRSPAAHSAGPVAWLQGLAPQRGTICGRPLHVPYRGLAHIVLVEARSPDPAGHAQLPTPLGPSYMSLRRSAAVQRSADRRAPPSRAFHPCDGFREHPRRCRIPNCSPGPYRSA